MYGISTQDTDYQAEAQQRLHLPFPLLSDLSLQLTHALKLPTFKVDRWPAAHIVWLHTLYNALVRLIQPCQGGFSAEMSGAL